MVRIEISHRDILLTFFDRPYLPTFSPVNMMMNNISWRASECVSPGESPGSLRLLPMSSSFLCTTLSLGEWGWRGAGERKESEVDNRSCRTHTSCRNPPVQGPFLSPSTPKNIFISIIKQFFYMLIHQSGLALICRRGAGWRVLLPLFRCAPLPGRHLSRYEAHKAPALSALIDQRLAVKEESSTPYQWCSTSAPEKSLGLPPQHTQCCR